jgi:DNA primase
MKKYYKRIDVDKLKETIDPTDFYLSEGQEIKSKCASYWKSAGLCPFHADRNAGTFYINSQNGAFNCFACDAHGGDVIAFLQMKYGIPFLEAVQQLAKRWGCYE